MSPTDDIDRRLALKLLGGVGVLGTVGTGVSLAQAGSETGSDGSDSNDESDGSGEQSPMVAWRHTYENDPRDPPTLVDGLVAAATTADGYLFAGNARDRFRDPGNKRRMYLLWTDEAGEAQRMGLYGDGAAVLNGMIEADDGYLLVGSRTPKDSSDQRALAVKVGSDHEQQWRYEYDPEDGSDAAFADATVTDGGYVVSGHTSDGELVLAHLAADGTEEWVTTYDGNSLDEESVAVVPSVDGGFVVLEQYGVSVALVKFSDDGEAVWEYNRKVAGQITGGDMVAVEDGYTFVGTGPRGGDRVDVVLESVAPDGSSRWEQSYDAAGREEYGFGLVTTDDGYAVAGLAGTGDRDGQDRDAALLTTDRDGTLRTFTTVGDANLSQSAAGIAATDDGYVLAGRADDDTQDPTDPSSFLCKLTTGGDVDDDAGETGDSSDGSGDDSTGDHDDSTGDHDDSTGDSDDSTGDSDDSTDGSGDGTDDGSDEDTAPDDPDEC